MGNPGDSILGAPAKRGGPMSAPNSMNDFRYSTSMSVMLIISSWFSCSVQATKAQIISFSNPLWRVENE